MASKIVSWAIRELMPRIECFVSSDCVNRQMSETSVIGLEPCLVRQIVVALHIWETLRASIISTECPEWEIPIATQSAFK